MALSMCLVNEVLFTVKNYFGMTPKTVITSVLSGFYTDEEISEVELIIEEFAEKVVPKIDELKNLKYRTSVGKRKCECEDLVVVYTLLDAQKADLPNFVISNALRLPVFKIEDVDAYQLAVKTKTLSNKVNDLKNASNKVNAKVS